MAELSVEDQRVTTIRMELDARLMVAVRDQACVTLPFGDLARLVDRCRQAEFPDEATVVVTMMNIEGDAKAIFGVTANRVCGAALGGEE